MWPERVGIELRIFSSAGACSRTSVESGGADLVFGAASQVVAV